MRGELLGSAAPESGFAIAWGIRLQGVYVNAFALTLSGMVAAEKDTMSNSVELTDATFSSEIEKHEGLAVVDFWAPWCGPCRMVGPVLEELAGEYAGKAKVAKVDVDQNQSLAQRFGVRSIPLILFFKNGKVVDQVLGAVPKAQLAAKFQQHAA